jgi:hypothetical protein
LSVAIDGNALYRVFDVQSGSFSLSNFALRNGVHVNQGGGLYVGPLVSAQVQNVTVASAVGDLGANPLFADLNANVELTDVRFTNQIASQIYLHLATLKIVAPTPVGYLIQGTGASFISKYGEGFVDFIAPNGEIQGYALGVFEGGASFTGNLSSSCTVYPGGELYGDASVSECSNLGALQPGTASQLGTVQVAGDFYSVNATTEIKLDPMGGIDRVLVEGNIFLEGGVLQFVPMPGMYTQGTKYTAFLTTQGGINGAFGSISSGELDVQVTYFPQFIEMEIMSTATIE